MSGERTMSKEDRKTKLSIDVSNSTSLSWDEEHRGIYLKPKDIVRMTFVKAKWRVRGEKEK